MSSARALLVALVLSMACAGVIAVVSRTPASVRDAVRTEDPTLPTFTDEQIARHGAYRGPLYLAFGLSLVTELAFLLMLRGRAIAELVERIERVRGGWPVHAVVVAATVAAAAAVIALPISFVRGYAIQKAWHLSNQDIGAWLLDQAKGFGLSLVFAAIAALAFFAVARWQPRWWWAIGAATFTALTALMVLLFPVVIAPLFNRFTPLQDAELTATVRRLASQVGVEVGEVLVVDASKRSRAENAYVAGLGTTKQVVLYDTLLENHDPDDVAFVVAHELAHQAEGHVVKGLVLSAAGLFAGFALLQWLVSSGHLLRFTGADSILDLRILPGLLLFALVAGLVVQPIENAVSRSFESKADAVAFDLIEDPEPAVRAFRRLAISNIADLRPPAAAVWFFYTHPPIADRIEAARAVGAAKP